MRTQIESIRTIRDTRGALFEPLDAEQLSRQHNTHVVLTQPGHIRGNHYHLKGTEISVVPGPAFIRLKEDKAIYDFDVPDGETWRLTIPPSVVHAYRNPGPGVMLLIAFNTELHNPAEPDAVREEILA